MTGALGTDPLWNSAWKLDEKAAVTLYEAATRLDNIPGHYEPDDTGSSASIHRRMWVLIVS
jgi:hypothetical protein